MKRLRESGCTASMKQDFVSHLVNVQSEEAVDGYIDLLGSVDGVMTNSAFIKVSASFRHRPNSRLSLQLRKDHNIAFGDQKALSEHPDAVAARKYRLSKTCRHARIADGVPLVRFLRVFPSQSHLMQKCVSNEEASRHFEMAKHEMRRVWLLVDVKVCSFKQKSTCESWSLTSNRFQQDSNSEQDEARNALANKFLDGGSALCLVFNDFSAASEIFEAVGGKTRNASTLIVVAGEESRELVEAVVFQISFFSQIGDEDAYGRR